MSTEGTGFSPDPSAPALGLAGDVERVRCRRFDECGRSIANGWVILQESEDGEEPVGVCLWHFAMEQKAEQASADEEVTP
jgi:hypothetical protein